MKFDQIDVARPGDGVHGPAGLAQPFAQRHARRAEPGQFGAGQGKAQRRRVDDGEVVAALGDVGLYGAHPRRIDLHAQPLDKGRYVKEALVRSCPGPVPPTGFP